MATINTHISVMRDYIREWSDDSTYSDAFLYQIIKSAKNQLQYRKARQWYYLSDLNYQRYCVSLEEGVSHNCDCVAVGCKVLKTEVEIPRPLSGRNRDIISVFTLGGKKLPHYLEEELEEMAFDDIKKGKPSFSIIGRKIVIFNAPKKWKAVQVEGIFEDPTQWAGITLCDKETGEDTGISCFKVLEDEFPIDSELELPMYQMALQLLQIPLQILEDRTNDSSADIKV